MTHIMDFTTEDLAAGILGSTGPYTESLKRATNAINAAIAAAVQAEREACAHVAESNKSHTEHGELGECCDTAEEIAAAIRARNNGSK